jgi:hypothetical protein
MAYDDALFQLGMDIARGLPDEEVSEEAAPVSDEEQKNKAAQSLDVRDTRHSFPAPPQEGVGEVSKKQRGLNRRAA